jgi:excisionase family DNA binding protein
MKKGDTINNLLTVKGVAKRLNVSERTVWRLVKAKKLKPIKISSRIYRFSEKDLLTFLKKHKAK